MFMNTSYIPKKNQRCRYCESFYINEGVVICNKGHSVNMNCDGKDFSFHYDYELEKLLHHKECEPSVNEIITKKTCAKCNKNLIYTKPELPGAIFKTKENIIELDICLSCLSEHCKTTDCKTCSYKTKGRCKYSKLKKPK